MSMAIMNLAAAAAIVCELMLICSGIETEQQVEAPFSRQLRDTVKGSISLTSFIQLRKISYPGYDNPIPIFQYGCKNDAWMHYPADDVRSSTLPENNEWVLNWDKLDFGRSGGGDTCPSDMESTHSGCYCVSPRSMAEFQSDPNIVSLISLKELESNSAENMVITGLKFTLDKDRIIQMQMKEGKLLTDGSVGTSTDWKDPVDFVRLTESTSNSVNYAKLNFTKDVVMFDTDTRIIYLDRIILPTDYIVTGVKFSHFNHPGHGMGIRMEVKGTKYDQKYNLQHDTTEWFDSDNDRVVMDDSYNRDRTEIILKGCTPPSDKRDIKEFSYSNRLIRFRGSGDPLGKGDPIVPFFESESIESVDSRPLRGIELSYKTRWAYSGFIMLKIHNLVITSHETHDRTVSPEELISIRLEALKRHTTTIESTTFDDSGETRSSSMQKGSAPKYYCQLIVVTILPILFAFW